MMVARRRWLGARAEGLRRIRCVRQALRLGVHCGFRRGPVPPHSRSTRPENSLSPQTVGKFVVAGRHVDATFLALRRLATRVN
jgi:hypothetical protein